MKLSLICAMSKNQAIGKDNSLPWRLSGDLQYFKSVTMGHCIIMGRKTWESIGRPLPGRPNIVVTRNSDFEAEGAVVVASLDEAIKVATEISAKDNLEEAFVIGGATLYQASLPIADKFHLTKVDAEIDGDTYLTGFDETQWKEVSRTDYPKSDKNEFDYSICVLERLAS